jgi:hypothetical protein
MELRTARKVAETALENLHGFLRVGIRLGASPALRVEISPDADVHEIERALQDIDAPVEIVTTRKKGAIEAH